MFSHILSVQQQEPPQTASDTFALIQSEAIRHVFLFFPFAFVEIFRVSALLTSNHQDFIQEFFLTDSVCANCNFTVSFIYGRYETMFFCSVVIVLMQKLVNLICHIGH